MIKLTRYMDKSYLSQNIHCKHDRKLCSIRFLSSCSFSTHGYAFSSQLLTPHVSFQLLVLHFCFKPFMHTCLCSTIHVVISALTVLFQTKLPAFQFTLISKRGLMLVTQEVLPVNNLPLLLSQCVHWLLLCEMSQVHNNMCVCVCMCVCVYVFICVYLHKYICMSIFIHTLRFIYVYVSVCLCICVYVFAYVYMYEFIYILIHTQRYICVYMFIHI